MDRFTYTEKPPVIVGSCTVCHEDIQQGDEKRCGDCGDMTCEDCLRACWVCHKKGCKWCSGEKDTNKEDVCEQCLGRRTLLVNRVVSSIDIEDYYFSDKRQTDEETIIEYTSLNDQPGIEVRIKKVRE